MAVLKRPQPLQVQVPKSIYLTLSLIETVMANLTTRSSPQLSKAQDFLSSK